jgi:hypothetical protein
MQNSRKVDKDSKFTKDRDVNQTFEYLPQADKDILSNASAGVAFDAVDTADVKSKANISSQNADTGLPSFSAGDTKPYERKNMPAGFHKRGTGSK